MARDNYDETKKKNVFKLNKWKKDDDDKKIGSNQRSRSSSTQTTKPKQTKQTVKGGNFYGGYNVETYKKNTQKAVEKRQQNKVKKRDQNSYRVNGTPVNEKSTYSSIRPKPAATADEMRKQRDQRMAAQARKSGIENDYLKRDNKEYRNSDEGIARRRALKNTPKLIGKAVKDTGSGYAQTFEDVGEMAASDKDIGHTKAAYMGIENDKSKVKSLEQLRAETAKAARERRLELDKKQQERQEEWNKLTKGAKGLEKAYYGAVESGVGMGADYAVGALTGTGQFGALASMGLRTYGTTRGSAEREGATESEDRLYSLVNAGKEVGTELMFYGIGPAAKAYGSLAKGAGRRSGLDLASRVANTLTKGLTGKKADLAYAGTRIAFGVGEENIEEAAAWGLDPIIKELTYGKNVRERFKESLLQGAPQITSQAEADRVAAYFATDEFEKELVKEFREEGVPKKEAEQLAEKYKEFYTAYYSGDEETADKIAAEMSGTKKEWSNDELLETVEATTLLTATTGGVGSLYTSQKGNQLFDSPEMRDRFGDDAERIVAEAVKNTSNKQMSAKAQAMEDRLKSGNTLTGTQKYELWQGYLEKQRTTAQKGEASYNTVENTMRKEDTLPKSIEEMASYNTIRQRTWNEAYSSVASTAEAFRKYMDSDMSISQDESARTDAAIKAVADLKAGGLTVGDVHEFAYGNTLARETLKAETGLDLDELVVYEKDGTVDLAATNEATEDALYKMNTQYAVETAREAKEFFIDTKRGEIDTDMMSRLGSAGQSAWKEVNKDLDPRDLNNYLTNASAASFFYAYGRNTEGVSAENALEEHGATFKSVDDSLMAKAFEAGVKDRIIESTPGYGQEVKAGEKAGFKKTKAVKTGQLFLEAEVGDEMQRTFQALAESTNFNIHLVSDLSPVDEDGNPVLDKNGNPVQINGMTKGNDIYLNVNASAEQNLGYVFMHEMTHMLKQFAPEEYMALENLVREKWFEKDYEGMQREIRRRIDLYGRVGKQNLTEAEAMEEIVCDAMAEAIDDPNFAAEICETDINLGQQILNSIKAVLRSIRQMFASNEFKDENFHGTLLSYLGILDEAERMWINALAVARQNRADGLIADWQTKANKSQRLSVGYHAGDLGKSTVDDYAKQGYGRGSGHFGFGTYFVGNPDRIKNYNKRNGQNAPIETVDFDKYNLFKPTDFEQAIKLHDALRTIDGLIDEYSDFIKYKDSIYDRKLWDEEYYKESVVKRDIETLIDAYDDEREPNKEVKERIDKYISEMPEYYRERIESKARQNYEEAQGREVDEAQIRETLASRYGIFGSYLYDNVDDYVENNIESKIDSINRAKTIPYEQWYYEASKEYIEEYSNEWSRDKKELTGLSRKLREALSYEHSESEIEDALLKTEEIVKGYQPEGGYRLNAERGLDSGATVFMKALGYEGVDVRHIDEMDNTGYGSVIYDLKDGDLARKQEIGTARFSISPEQDSEGNTLSEEQVKDTRNTNPTTNPDIRYSLNDPTKANTYAEDQILEDSENTVEDLSSDDLSMRYSFGPEGTFYSRGFHSGSGTNVTGSNVKKSKGNPLLESGKEILAKTMKKSINAELKKQGISTRSKAAKEIVNARIESVMNFMDAMNDFMEETGLQYTFIGMQEVHNAKISVRKTSDGIQAITMSAMVKNGEYPINFDFTTICKKRQAFNAIIEKLTDESAEGVDISLSPKELGEINNALRKEGLETACLGCFVEARRYNMQNYTNKVCDLWNKCVDEYAASIGVDPADIEDFNFSNGEETTQEKFQDAADTFFAYENTEASKKNPEARFKHIIRSSRMTYMKHLHPADLITSNGIQHIKDMSTKDKDFFGMLKSAYGVAAPKETIKYVPYNSEVARLPDNKGKDKDGNTQTMLDYLKSIGGIRMQSFSDYLVANTFDYMQMVADMAAKGFPAHAYTKEIAFARVFGMTGIKINLSIMFDVVNLNTWRGIFKNASEDRLREIASKYAGLQYFESVDDIPDEFKDYDKDGNLILDHGSIMEINEDGVKGYLTYLVGDENRSQRYWEETYRRVLEETGDEEQAREQANEYRKWIQSINFKEAKELQRKKGYGANCGMIGVGLSDANILLMLNDDNIPYIIPYHASGLPDVIKQHTGLNFATNYEDTQNTRIFVSFVNSEGKELGYEYVRNLKDELGSWQKAWEKVSEEIRNGDIVANGRTARAATDTEPAEVNKDGNPYVLHGTADFDFYAKLEDGATPQEAAELYLEYCDEYGLLPVFPQFAGHPNYYKLLVDYSVTDLSDNKTTSPQGVVRNIYPGSDGSIANIDEGSTDYEGIKSILKDEFEKLNKKNEHRDEVVNKIVEEWGQKYSISPEMDAEYMDAVNNGDMETAQRLVDEAAYTKNYVSVAHHGTPNGGFTVFGGSQTRNGAKAAGTIWFAEEEEHANVYRSYPGGWPRAENPQTYHVYLDTGIWADIGNGRVEALDYSNNGWGDASKDLKRVAKAIASYTAWQHRDESERTRTRKITNALTEIARNIGADFVWQVTETQEFADLCIEQGLDSVVAWEEHHDGDGKSHMVKTWGVFKPSQVKSSDPVTYAEDGSVIPLSERFDPDNDDIRYSLPTQDSDGNILTDGQMEYFQNSQARDEKGRLVPVYHVTRSAGFTVFDPMRAFDGVSISFSNDMDFALNYSSDDESVEDWQTAYQNRYGMEEVEPENIGHYMVYLDIRNPLIVTEDRFNDMDPYEWPVYAKANGYDGVIYRNFDEMGADVYQVFSANQIKDTRNENPTENPDIRFSITEDEAMSHMAHDYAYDNSGEALAYYEQIAATLPDEVLNSDGFINHPTQVLMDKLGKYGEADKKARSAKNKYKYNPVKFDNEEDFTSKFFDGLTRYADGMKFDDPVLEEGRTRMARSRNDFFNSTKARWNQMWETDDKVLDIKSIEKSVKEFVMRNMSNSNTTRKYRSDTVKKTLINMRLAYWYAKEGRIDVADALLWHTALRMIEDVEFYREDSNYETYKELRDYLRNTRIQIGEEYWSDVDYAAFRKANYGRINLVRGETNIDKIFTDLYEEKKDGTLGGIAPEWFSPEAFEKNNYKFGNPPDILLQIDAVLDNMQPYAEAYSSEYCADWATDIASSLLDIMQSEGKAMVSKADRYENTIKLMKVRHAEAMLKVRQQRDNAVRRERAKFKEYKEKRKEKQYHALYFKGIQKSYKTLTERLLSNTADKNIPEQYKKELAGLLAAFDLQTVGSKKYEAREGRQSQKTIKMGAMKAALKSIENKTDEFHIADTITDIMDELLGEDVGNGSNRSIEGLTIDELNSSELQRIDKLLKALIHEFNTYKSVKVGVKRQQVKDIGKAQVDSALEHAKKFGPGKDYRGIFGFLDKIINLDELTPSYLFRRIDPKKDGLWMMYGQLEDSHDRYIRNTVQLTEWMEEILGDYHKNGILTRGAGDIADWRSENYAQTFNLENGTVTLTPAQMMSVYCLSNRMQAYNHMVGAGIVVSPTRYNAKMTDLLKKANVNLPVKLTDADIKTIKAALNPDQIKVADELQKLMAEKMAAWGNEASMNVLGIELFGEPDYFPIRSDKAALTRDLDEGEFVQAIRNFGFTKAVQPGARNAIMVDDIFDVVAEHCNNMNLYNAYSEAMNDFMKVYNYRDFREDGSEYTVQQAVAHAYSQKATTFILSFMKDLNGNVSRGKRTGVDDVFNASLANAKKSSVFANSRVAAQQPTAIGRAFIEIDPKYAAAITKPETGIVKEMFEHCPIAKWKSLGYYDVNLGRNIEDVIMNNYNVLEETATWAYGALDNVTWGGIWQMVKAETEDKHKDVKKGSDEYWDLCNRRMREVVAFTQVVDSPFHRSHAMRSKEYHLKLATAFGAEPTLTFNMVRDGYVRGLEMIRSGDVAGGSKLMARTLSVFVFTTALTAAAAALPDVLRGKNPDGDDDEDRNFLQKWYANFLENFKDNINLLNNIYFVKDVKSLFDGWEINNLGLQGWKYLATSVRQLTDDPYVRSKDPWFKNLFIGVGYLTGAPVKTLWTDLGAIINKAKDIVGFETPVWDKWYDYMSGIKISKEDEDKDAAFLGVLFDRSDSDSDEDTSEKKSKRKSKDADSDADSEEQKEAVPLSENEMAEERAKKAEDIKAKYDGLSGEEKDKKVWSSVTTFAKDQRNGMGMTDIIAKGDYAAVAQYREMYVEAGGNGDYFDERVMDMTKKEFKKGIKYDQTIGERSDMKEMWRYMVAHGYSREEISADILYKSDLAKDMKVAFRLGDEDLIAEVMAPLVDAGIEYVDVQRLWDNRNRMQLSSYNGRFKDKLKSTGNFIWPTTGTITSHFGYRNAPTAGASSNHPAIDIGAPQGTAVVAADGGVVIYAGHNGGYGNSVGIKHDNGMVTYYNHLYGWNVKVGDAVGQGQQIGQVGSTGISTGAHLDFKILDPSGKPVDPEKYLNKKGA